MNPLIRKGGSQHRMSQFSRPQPRSNPGCYLGGASTHHQVPRLHLSTPTTQAPRGIFLLAFKSLYFISKGRNGPVPPTRCGRRRPRPRATRSACGHAQRSPLPRRGRKPKQAARENGAQTGGGGGRLGVPTSGSSAAPHHSLASSAVPFPRPRSRRRGSRRPYLHQQPEQQRRHPAEPAAHGFREDRPKPCCTASSGPLRTPGRAGGRRGYEPTSAGRCAPSRRSSRKCQAALAARPRATSRARARGLRARKVCGARCGTRRQRGWVRRLPGVSSPGGNHLVSPL